MNLANHYFKTLNEQKKIINNIELRNSNLEIEKQELNATIECLENELKDAIIKLPDHTNSQLQDQINSLKEDREKLNENIQSIAPPEGKLSQVNIG